MLDKLPEKWCVKANKDNIDIITKYYDEGGCRKNKLTCYKNQKENMINDYFHSHNLTSEKLSIMYSLDPCSNFNSKTPKYPEISFEDFQRLVLNKLNEVQYEIC